MINQNIVGKEIGKFISILLATILINTILYDYIYWKTIYGIDPFPFLDISTVIFTTLGKTLETIVIIILYTVIYSFIKLYYVRRLYILAISFLILGTILFFISNFNSIKEISISLCGSAIALFSIAFLYRKKDIFPIIFKDNFLNFSVILLVVLSFIFTVTFAVISSYKNMPNFVTKSKICAHDCKLLGKLDKYFIISKNKEIIMINESIESYYILRKDIISEVKKQ